MTSRFRTVSYEPPVARETSREARERRERNAASRASRKTFLSERCGVCGFARINVRHEEDPEHSPEGPEYYAGMELCAFVPTGESVR